MRNTRPERTEGEPEQLDLFAWTPARDPSPVRSEPGYEPDATSLGTDPVLLTHVDPSRNRRRFYSLALATSLWGEHGVVRRWGRIGAQGRMRTDWHGGHEASETELAALARVKRQRGYQ